MPRPNGAHPVRSLIPPKPCESCRGPIPFRPWQSVTIYLSRRFCSSVCSHAARRGQPLGSVTARWQRALAQIAERERHPTLPTYALPPFGHSCEVCGDRVRAGHPIHRAERPDRAGAVVVGH